MPQDDDELPEYLQRLDSFMSGDSQTTLYFELEKRGWTPEDPDTLPDEDLSRALTNLIWSLKDLHVFISDTDHLSDRQLYTELLAYCDEPNVCFAGIPGAANHWSPIGACDEEDIQIWLQFYATKEDRERHAKEYPEDPMPPSELPSYPRPWLPEQEFPQSDFDDETLDD